MKNLANLIDDSIDYIDNLPNRDKVRPPKDGRDHYRGCDYPWKKVNRFLTSRVGRLWDRVFSEYVHLDWVPRQYKTKEQIGFSVILNTFIKEGKVWYFDRGFGGNERPIENCGDGWYSHSDIFYIHPTTKILCYYKPKKVDRQKLQEEEEAKNFRVLGDYHQLLKFDGIWYEVKGEPNASEYIEIEGLHYRIVSSVPNDGPYKIVDGKILIPAAVGNYRYYYGGRYSGENKIGPRDRMISRGEDAYYWKRSNYNSVRITLYRQLNHKDLKKYGVKNDVKVVGKRCSTCGSSDCTLKHDNKRCSKCGGKWCVHLMELYRI